MKLDNLSSGKPLSLQRLPGGWASGACLSLLLLSSPVSAQIYGSSSPALFNYATTLNLPTSLSPDLETFLKEFPKLAALDRDTSADRHQQEKFELAMATHMAEALNQVRSKERRCGDQLHPAVGPVSASQILSRVARSHNLDMITHRFFAHKGSDGSNGGARIIRSGYQWRSWGENLATGYASVERVVEGWLASPTHCANLMNPDFREFGIHKAVGLDRDDYWTLNFASPI